MNILSILLLTVIQFFMGSGIFALTGLRLKHGLFFPLSVLLGLALSSLIPFLLQLLFIPITAVNLVIALILVAFLLNIKFRKTLEELKYQLHDLRFGLRLYELPSVLLIALIVFVSVWRCFYYPPVPRDLTSGPEVIAQYTIKEKTLVNSVFSVDLHTTNNQFKPPFVTSLQVIYKYAGFPFGQVWLSIVFICFVIFLYQVMRQKIHPLLAGLLLVFFLAIPEMYAYTFMVLFDYSNAVFFCLSVYFLIHYFDSRQLNMLALSGIWMGFATYSRSETLVLAGILSAGLIWHFILHRDNRLWIIKGLAYFLLPSLLIYLLSVYVYINFYLPMTYEVGHLVNKNLFDLGFLFRRFTEMNSKLIFSEQGLDYYGYFFYLFLIFLIFDLVMSDKWDKEPLNWIYAIMVVYLGLPFLSYLLPLMDIDNSTKRGLFKIFPLMLLYMGNSTMLRELSEKIREWESR